MVDLLGADKGNISLPPRLQSPEVLDNEPDDLKQVMILNMQKAVYQVRITDIAKRIQRLQSRNTELEESSVAEKLLRSQTDVETTDQIAELNREIFSELEKITDHQKRIQTVRRWMEEEKQAHLDKLEAGNKKYAKTRLAIRSEIKILNAKINTLEEYKVSKSDLRNKLSAGNNLIAQREEETKQRCEQIQRKFKIGREKLKKEMYARLLGLAGTFQMEVAASVAKPIHRLMRENIFIKNELIDIVRESVPKKETMKRNKETNGQIVSKIGTSKRGTVQQLITSKIQGCILETVKEQHTRVKDCLGNLKEFDNESRMKSLEVIYGCMKSQADKVLQHLSRLETGLHRQQTELGLVNYLRDRSKNELQRCINVLHDAKFAVACALKTTDNENEILEMEDRQLMFYLLDIISKGDTQRWGNRTPSLATVSSPEEAYRIGDLGFDPSHIELQRFSKSIQRKPSRLSTLKILADLGIRLSRVGSVQGPIKPWETDIISLADSDDSDSDDEKSDEMNLVSSLSLVSQEEDLDQKTTVPEVVGDEEPGTGDEQETDIDGTMVREEEVIEKKRGEDDNAEIITEKNENDGSRMLVDESNAEFSAANEIDE